MHCQISFFEITRLKWIESKIAREGTQNTSKNQNTSDTQNTSDSQNTSDTQSTSDTQNTSKTQILL